MLGLESIAYAIARGAVRAYLDVLAEPRKVESESPSDEDLAMRDSARAAVARMHGIEAASAIAGPDYSPQTDRSRKAAGGDAEKRRVTDRSDD